MFPPLLADVNIAVSVIRFLRSKGVDVVSALEEGLGHSRDEELLATAHAMNRFILTHDSDFGSLAVFIKQPSAGIIYLRPGGRVPNEVMTDLEDLMKKDIDWTKPIILVYREGYFRIRRLDTDQ